jgi:N-acetyl-anhydromuramyl-L-alanine amidase AmpD
MSLAGLPAGTLDAPALNRSAIAICLVGNVDRRPPTDAQVAALVALVRSLQAEYGIDEEGVRFRSELGAAGGSPGAFPVSAFRDRLAR